MTTEPSVPSDSPLPPDSGAGVQPDLPSPAPERLTVLPVEVPVPWLLRNLPALVAIGLHLMLLQVFVLFLRNPMPKAENTPAPIPRDLEALAGTPAHSAQVALMLLGMLLTLCGLVAMGYALSIGKKRELLQAVSVQTRRYLPDVGGMDMLASIVAWMVWSTTCYLLGLQFLLHAPEAHSAVRFAANALGFVAACAVVILLARLRAGGAHGARGLWPFWTLPEGRTRSIWHDIGVGAITYVISAWMVTLAVLVNTLLLEAFGHKVDAHDLIGEILRDQPWWALVVFALSATVFAAICEEILFRGVLYNAWRRTWGSLPAALASAAVFAAVHMIASNLLGLFLLGLIMTWLYDRTGRLVASMTFHFINNAVSVTTVLVAKYYL